MCGWRHRAGMWRRADVLTWVGLMMAPVLPQGPSDKFPMAVLPWGMWNVRMDRCNYTPGAIKLVNSVLVTQAETMDYVSYW